MFLSSFNGTWEAGPNTHNLDGTYIVQFANESSHFMVMPAILTAVTATEYAPSLQYVNDFHMENLKTLWDVREGFFFLPSGGIGRPDCRSASLHHMEEVDVNQGYSCRGKLYFGLGGVRRWRGTQRPIICWTQILKGKEL